MAAGVATSAVAVIVLGMFVGRLIGGQLALRVRPVHLLLAALTLSLCGFAVFWIATVPAAAVLGLFICGLGNAMHFPLSVGLAVEVAGPHLADRAAASASYAMVVSFGIAPFALSASADRIGAHGAFLFVPMLLAGAAAVALGLRRALRRPAAIEPIAATAAAPSV
jgi:fucose permease